MIGVLRGTGELVWRAGDSADGPACEPSLGLDTTYSSREVELPSPYSADKGAEVEGDRAACPKSHPANR